MSQIRISKQFRFEAAHRLVNGYPDKCRYIHGHSWLVEVTLSQREGVQLDRYGFVEDFVIFKSLKEWIDTYLDHAMLVNKYDITMRKFLADEGQKNYIVEGNPTSENLCLLIASAASRLLPQERTYLSKVEIMETCTSKATLDYE